MNALFDQMDQPFRELAPVHSQHQFQAMKEESQEPASDEWALAGIVYPAKHGKNRSASIVNLEVLQLNVIFSHTASDLSICLLKLADVMLGRGGESNYHNGNLAFRSFIQEHKQRYQEARKQDKPVIALEVVLAWRDLSPPGRFLARMDNSRADSLWYDVGDDAACKRAGRTLGERSAPKVSAGDNSNSKRTGKKDLASTRLGQYFMEKKESPDLISSCFKDGPTRKVLDSTKLSSSSGLKRPRDSLDYIASLTSSALSMGDSSTSRHNESDANERLQPSHKRFKATTNRTMSDAKGHGSAASEFTRAFDLRQEKKSYPKTTNKVTTDPNGYMHKLMNAMDSSIMTHQKDSPTPPSPSQLLDIGTILEDCQRRHAVAMQEDIPTAEFLTRTVFSD